MPKKVIKELKKKPRVFVSFHSEDKYAKNLLVAQSKNKKQEIIPRGIKKSKTTKWNVSKIAKIIRRRE